MVRVEEEGIVPMNSDQSKYFILWGLFEWIIYEVIWLADWLLALRWQIQRFYGDRWFIGWSDS